MRYAERAALEEVQRRREQVINYLETVIRPIDEQSRKVIDNLRAQVVSDRVRLAEINQLERSTIIAADSPCRIQRRHGGGP